MDLLQIQKPEEMIFPTTILTNHQIHTILTFRDHLEVLFDRTFTSEKVLTWKVYATKTTVSTSPLVFPNHEEIDHLLLEMLSIARRVEEHFDLPVIIQMVLSYLPMLPLAPGSVRVLPTHGTMKWLLYQVMGHVVLLKELCSYAYRLKNQVKPYRWHLQYKALRFIHQVYGLATHKIENYNLLFNLIYESSVLFTSVTPYMSDLLIPFDVIEWAELRLNL